MLFGSVKKALVLLLRDGLFAAANALAAAKGEKLHGGQNVIDEQGQTDITHESTKNNSINLSPAIAFQSARRPRSTERDYAAAPEWWWRGADGRLPITVCQIIHRINNNGVSLFASSRVAPIEGAKLGTGAPLFVSPRDRSDGRVRPRCFNFNLASASLLLSNVAWPIWGALSISKCARSI